MELLESCIHGFKGIATEMNFFRDCDSPYVLFSQLLSKQIKRKLLISGKKTTAIMPIKIATTSMTKTWNLIAIKGNIKDIPDVIKIIEFFFYFIIAIGS